MNEKINKETAATLLKALGGLKDDMEQLRLNREKKLWRKIDNPCSLNDALNGLTKDDLDKIRRNYEYKNMSSLKKAELAVKLAELVPADVKKFIYRLDAKSYELIKAIINNSGYIAYENQISMSSLQVFMEYSIIFPGVYNKKKILFMPQELISFISKFDDAELRKVVQRNDEWIKLTQGLLYYYGVMAQVPIKERVQKLTAAEIDLMEFVHVINLSSEIYGHVRNTQYGYKNEWVLEADKIVEEHNMRTNLDFYPFSKEQLLKAGEADYIYKSLEMEKFIDFLLENYDLSDDKIKEIVSTLNSMINRDASMKQILEYLNQWMRFNSSDFVMELKDGLENLIDNTKLWKLKGYTYNEVYKKETQVIKPLTMDIFKSVSPAVDVARQAMEEAAATSKPRKVGRNEPCPCGSGKKYKKCCGK